MSSSPGEKITAIVTTDKESVLTSKDGRTSLRLPAGAFSEEVRVEMQVLPGAPSTGMRLIKALDINAFAVKRKDATVTSLLKDAVITIVNTPSELKGLNPESVRLYYMDEKDRRWKPVASQFNPATLTLTGTTNHFSYYGEQADPVISGPGKIMAFEADLHSGTVKASYPLELPPAPGGFQPSLALTYDSGRVDGMKNRRALGSWAGIGWSLSIGSISFDEEDNAYYLEIGGVGYEIVRGGDKYYTRPDSFYQILRDEANQTWQVYDRGGATYQFGGTPQSRQYYYGATGRIYYRWDLTLIRDTHGNQAEVSYVQDKHGTAPTDFVRSAYPEFLRYSQKADGTYNAEVFFSINWDENTSDGNVRKDNPIGRGPNPAARVMENRWLDYVEVRFGGALVRKYEFGYNLSDPARDRVESNDYGLIYYSGQHKLMSVTQKDKNGASSLPAMTFSYTNREVFIRDPDSYVYIGNPGNPTSGQTGQTALSWPYLTQVTNGYGATATFTYAQIPASTATRIWTRQAVTERRINPGIGPEMVYTYTYDGNPEYKGYTWTARYRGFRKVKETDAQGHYTWRYYHTTGIVSGNDWERLTGQEYQSQQHASGDPNALRTETSTWNWAKSEFWTPTPYTFLDRWNGYGTSNGYFNTPVGIAADSAGNIYVVEQDNRRVQKLTNNGSFIDRWGGPGIRENQFLMPLGGAVSSDNKMYVADADQRRVSQFDLGGNFIKWWYVGQGLSGVAAYGSTIYVTYSNYVRKYDSPDGSYVDWGDDPGEPQFASPQGLAVDSSGNVYVADTGNHRIVKLSPSGTVLGTFGSQGTGNSQFVSPKAVAVAQDSTNHIWVADTGNHRVKKFDASFQPIYQWGKTDNTPGTNLGEFNSPGGLVVFGQDPSKYVFISDSGNHRVQKLLDSDYVYGSTWGGYRSDLFPSSQPEDIALASTGNGVWVVDKGLHEVKKYDIYGNHNPATDPRIGGSTSGTADGQFNSPSGVGISPQDGAIFVADTSNHRVQKFTSAGSFLDKWGGPNPGSGNNQFNSPGDVVVYWDQPRSTGNIYVADAGNNRIQRFDMSGGYAGTISSGPEYGLLISPVGVAAFADGSVVVADSGNHRLVAFSSTGQFKWKHPENPAASSANGYFSSPQRVAVDSSGNIYVADRGNHRIQKLDSQRNYITSLGREGGGSGGLKSPEGIAVPSAGDHIYVADTGNRRVQKAAWLWEVRLEQIQETRGSQTRQTRYAYDNKGNTAAIFKDGDTATTSDDSTVWRLFQENVSTPNWIVDKVARERVYAEYKSTDNGVGYKVETRYFYDGAASYATPPTKGDLTQLQRYDPEPTSSPNTVTFKKTYYANGNLKTETDPNKSGTDYTNQRIEYTYDDVSSTFIKEKKLPQVSGQQNQMVETYIWDTRGARMTQETDINGQTTYYKYDDFWRPVQIARPGDFLDTSPTIQHKYNSWGTAGQQHLETIQTTSTPNNLWTRKYFDGLGRVVQVQARGETNKTIVATTTFSDRGLVQNEYVPQELVSTSLTGYKTPEGDWKRSTSQYDALKRVTQQTKPDGTTASHDYTVPWRDEVTNERGKKKRYYNDAFERLIKVEELDDGFAVYAATVYAYDFQDNLVKVNDAAGNETVSTYNGFARKVSMRDPDMGQWLYEYDAQGNLSKQTDAKSQTITFSYDELNRIKDKKQGGNTLAAYSYDDVSSGNMGKGRRTGMTDSSGSMAYKYDDRGRPSQETRAIAGDNSYTTSYAYDSADRLVTVTYPGGETVTQSYNGRGLPYSLTTTADPANPIVASTVYNNLALPTEINLGNNLLKTTYGYWGMEQSGGYYGKVYSIKTVKTSQPDPSHQEVRHTWDAIGNLTKRENVGGAETEDFGYDFLDRLTSASNYFIFGNSGGPPNTVNGPTRAAVDSAGDIRVVDAGNYRVAKYDSRGVYKSSFGSQGYGNGQFTAAAGIAIDASGNIYVSEWLGNNRVQKFDSSGNYVTQWDGSGSGTAFSQPQDLVFNPSNNYIYVVDKNNHRVVYFDTSGNYVNQWGGPNRPGSANGEFSYPWGIGVDSAGNIYVADSGNHRIQKFTATGGHLPTWGGPPAGSGNDQFNYPRDVAVDSSGNIWVMDTYNHRVKKMSSTGTFLMAYGSNGSGAVQFAYPRGIAVTANKVYVVDTNNSRLQAFDPSAHPNSSWAYNQIGNLTNNNGVSYTYGGSKPHAVTQVGAGAFYTYDNNGNMTDRAGMSLTPYQVRGRPWDVENRLVSVPGLADFTYDGDGFRVKKNDIGINTVYANKYYEKNLNTGVVTFYYYLGDKLVAYKQGTALRYIQQDHLTGTSLTTDSSGNPAGSIKYKPYGETRSFSGPLPAQKFTGQRLDETGLYYYNARYYDPGLGRFISADTIVPSFTKPQTLSRYSYADNNPLRYRDPTGHEGEDDDAPTWRQWLGKVAKGARDFVVDQAKTLYRDWIASGPIERGERYAQVADDFLPATVSFYAEKSQTLEGQSYIATQIVFTGGMIYLGTRTAPAAGTAAAGGKFLAHSGKTAGRATRILKAFKPGAKVVTLKKDTLVYRYFGGKAAEKGHWVTTELLSDPAEQLALPPENTAEFVRTYTIPAGTQVIIGEAARKFGRLGEAPQIYVADVGVLR